MSTLSVDLGQFLLGRTRSRLLATLFGDPENSFFVRQLSRRLSTSAGTVQRELRLLSDAGLILRTVRDGQVLYRANRKHPIFNELQAVLEKTTGVFHLLHEALFAVSEGIEFAFVYGSFAKREETADSDIDLLICGDISMDTMLEYFAPIARQFGRPVNPTVYTREELRIKLHKGNHFLQSLQSATLIFLIGDEDEFRAIR